MTDAFDTMFPSFPPMGAASARKIVAIMQRETPKNARIKLMQVAIKVGNLSDAAKDVYRAAIAQDAAGLEGKWCATLTNARTAQKATALSGMKHRPRAWPSSPSA